MKVPIDLNAPWDKSVYSTHGRSRDGFPLSSSGSEEKN